MTLRAPCASPARRFGLVGLVGLAGALAGCRVGGPKGDPTAYVETPPGDGGDEASAEEGGGSTGDEGGSGPPPDATGDDDAQTGDASPAGDGGAEEGGSCIPATDAAICDPVKNTGCNPLQQCDVDPNQTSRATGLCALAGPAEAGACMPTFFNATCPAKQTCAGGTCKSLCYCDADCPAGQCCSDTSGPKGFTLCKSCP